MYYYFYVYTGLESAINKVQQEEGIRCQPQMFFLVPYSCKCKQSLEEDNIGCRITRFKQKVLLKEIPHLSRKYEVVMYKLESANEVSSSFL